MTPPRHSRVCSSMIETILMGRPPVVTSNWKSTAHTRLGASAQMEAATPTEFVQSSVSKDLPWPGSEHGKRVRTSMLTRCLLARPSGGIGLPTSRRFSSIA